jgi:hypothetical protein
MPFVLISQTQGDELIQSKRMNVATSEDRDKLEALIEKRAIERNAYLEKYGDQIPVWADVIEREFIEEVPAV